MQDQEQLGARNVHLLVAPTLLAEQLEPTQEEALLDYLWVLQAREELAQGACALHLAVAFERVVERLLQSPFEAWGWRNLPVRSQCQSLLDFLKTHTDAFSDVPPAQP
jgi:hypothetical protein